MNDRYLFRGKRKDNGEWVYGHNIILTEQVKGRTFIVPTGECIDDCITKTGELILKMPQIEIVRETVGQYTGLKDKNGKKIFEGDIVKVYIKGYCTICTVDWAETVAHFQLWQINTIPKTPTHLDLGNYDCEVIGNIHDNPELLKGE